MMIDAVMCGDRNVILGMAVTGRSALEHASETVNFWVICQGYSEDDKEKLRKSWDHERLGTVTFHDIAGERLAQFRSTSYLTSKLTYARYYIADFFPGLSRCIYLDTDLLVLRDLAEAMHLELGDKAVAGVVDIGVRCKKSRPDLIRRLGIKDYRSYFSAAFLVVDIDFWRASGMTRKIIELSIEKKDVLHSQDQDALNIMFEGRAVLLDTSWNTSQYDKPDPIDGKIVHLIGGIKPWHARYEQKFTEDYYRDVIYARFNDILDRTAYRGRRPWNPLGLGKIVEWANAKVPTTDMVARKMRLMLGWQA